VSAPASRITEALNEEYNVLRLLTALCKPDDPFALDVRYPSGKKTAAVNTQHTFDMDTAMCSTGFRVFVFRRPGVNSIISCAPPAGLSWQYDASMYAPFGADPLVAPAKSSTYTVSADFAGKDSPLNMPVFNFTSGWQKHGMIVTFNKSSRSSAPNRSMIYLDAGEHFNFYGTSNTNVVCKMTVYGYYNGKVTPFAVVTNNTGVGNFNMAHVAINSGYYGYDVQYGAATTISNGGAYLTGSTGPVTTAHRHVCLAKYCENLGKITASRVLASAIKCTNTTPDQYLGGKIVQANIDKARFWSDYDSFEAIQNIKNRYDDDAKEGSFGVLRLDPLTDLQMRTYAAVDAAENILETFENLEQDSDFIAFACALPSTGNQTFNLVLTSVAEFVTEDQFLSPGFCDISQSSWNEAVQKSQLIPQFTRNKIHLGLIGKAIVNVAKKSYKGLMHYGPKVLQGAEDTAELLGKLAGIFA